MIGLNINTVYTYMQIYVHIYEVDKEVINSKGVTGTEEELEERNVI